MMQIKNLSLSIYGWLVSIVVVALFAGVMAMKYQTYVISGHEKAPKLYVHEFSTTQWAKRYGIHWVEASISRPRPGTTSDGVNRKTTIYFRGACLSVSDCVMRKITVRDFLIPCKTDIAGFKIIQLAGVLFPLDTPKAPSSLCGGVMLYEKGRFVRKIQTKALKHVEKEIKRSVRAERLIQVAQQSELWNGGNWWRETFYANDLIAHAEFEKGKN